MNALKPKFRSMAYCYLHENLDGKGFFLGSPHNPVGKFVFAQFLFPEQHSP